MLVLDFGFDGIVAVVARRLARAFLGWLFVGFVCYISSFVVCRTFAFSGGLTDGFSGFFVLCWVSLCTLSC